MIEEQEEQAFLHQQYLLYQQEKEELETYFSTISSNSKESEIEETSKNDPQLWKIKAIYYSELPTTAIIILNSINASPPQKKN